MGRAGRSRGWVVAHSPTFLVPRQVYTAAWTRLGQRTPAKGGINQGKLSFRRRRGTFKGCGRARASAHRAFHVALRRAAFLTPDSMTGWCGISELARGSHERGVSHISRLLCQPCSRPLSLPCGQQTLRNDSHCLNCRPCFRVAYRWWERYEM